MTREELTGFLENWENMTLLFNDREQARVHFPQLMEITLSGNDRVHWRASWAADKINEMIPGIAAPWIETLTGLLPGLTHNGKKRQFMKFISLYPVPPDSAGFLFDFCLIKMVSEAEDIAVRAYAMQILYNISQMEPDLKPELLQILEQEKEHKSSAGLEAKSKNLIQRLRKEIRDHPII
jgi:hypothetical protein